MEVEETFWEISNKIILRNPYQTYLDHIDLGHCGIYMWAAAPETEDRYTVSHMVTPWQRPCSLRSLVWTTSVGPGYSVCRSQYKIAGEFSRPGEAWKIPNTTTDHAS
ncbi:hypothetical protein YC2023_118559 [Brassica napus]